MTTLNQSQVSTNVLTLRAAVWHRTAVMLAAWPVLILHAVLAIVLAVVLRTTPHVT